MDCAELETVVVELDFALEVEVIDVTVEVSETDELDVVVVAIVEDVEVVFEFTVEFVESEVVVELVVVVPPWVETKYICVLVPSWYSYAAQQLGPNEAIAPVAKSLLLAASVPLGFCEALIPGCELQVEPPLPL